MLISTSRVKIQKSHCFWNSKKQHVLALMNSPWVFLTRYSIPNHPSVSQTAMSTLYFSSPFASLVHRRTLILLINWSVLLFAAAALELCCSCCQSDSTSHVYWTEFVTVFIWLSQTFSFQRSHMHQNTWPRFSNPAYRQPEYRWHSYFSYLSHIGHVTGHVTFFCRKLPLIKDILSPLFSTKASLSAASQGPKITSNTLALLLSQFLQGLA